MTENELPRMCEEAQIGYGSMELEHVPVPNTQVQIDAPGSIE